MFHDPGPVGGSARRSARRHGRSGNVTGSPPSGSCYASPFREPPGSSARELTSRPWKRSGSTGSRARSSGPSPIARTSSSCGPSTTKPTRGSGRTRLRRRPRLPPPSRDRREAQGRWAGSLGDRSAPDPAVRVGRGLHAGRGQPKRSVTRGTERAARILAALDITALDPPTPPTGAATSSRAQRPARNGLTVRTGPP